MAKLKKSGKVELTLQIYIKNDDLPKDNPDYLGIVRKTLPSIQVGNLDYVRYITPLLAKASMKLEAKAQTKNGFTKESNAFFKEFVRDKCPYGVTLVSEENFVVDLSSKRK